MKNSDIYNVLKMGFKTIPFNGLLGLQLKELDETSASIEFESQKNLIGNFMHQILHGGVISSVLDMVGGILVMSKAAAKAETQAELPSVLAKCSTINLNVNFLSPGKGEHFFANASLAKAGKRILFTHMELRNEQNLLIATGSGTYQI